MKTMLFLQVMEQRVEVMVAKGLDAAATATHEVMMGGVAGNLINRRPINLGRNNQLQIAEKLERPVDSGAINGRGFFLHPVIEFPNVGVAADFTEGIKDDLSLWC